MKINRVRGELFKEKDVLSYSGIHKWITRVAGAPKECEECGDTSDRRYQWANLLGGLHREFHKNRDEWKRMCIPCHKSYDISRLGANHKPHALKSHCKYGHKFTEENTISYLTGRLKHQEGESIKRICRTCRNVNNKNYRLRRISCQ